jgi:DNA modification methylase
VKSQCKNGHTFEYTRKDIVGGHVLMCGDSTKKEDVEKLMNGEKADITFTSPPYNVGHNLGYKSKDKYDGSGDNIENYDQFLTDWVMIALEHSRYVFNNIQMLANNKHDLIRHLAEVNDYICDVAFWKKSPVAPAMAENVMNSQVEMIWILGKENKRSINTGQFRGTLSNFIETSSSQKDNKNNDIHNATMPFALCDWVINNFTQTGMAIMDVFGGTGTTLIACEQTGRKCYMMELSEVYTDVIVDRYCKFTGNYDIIKNGEPYRWEPKTADVS